jgi:pre-mRNA-splicing factor 38A
MAKSEQYHKTDAKALLDDRGYSGPSIDGQNPAHLFEKAVRERIINSNYWNEQCFALNEATLCDRAAELDCIGGTTGITGKPTNFLCLAFKLIQLRPGKDIILEYLNFADPDEGYDSDVPKEEPANEDADDNEESSNHHGNGNGAGSSSRIEDPNALGKVGEFKYLRCLAAFYIRLAWKPVEIYKTLEPLLMDYRKIRRKTKDGFLLTYVDQFIDDLLTKDRMCATSLWKLPSRGNLEDLDLLEPRESPLEDEVDEMNDSGEDGDVEMME